MNSCLLRGRTSFDVGSDIFKDNNRIDVYKRQGGFSPPLSLLIPTFAFPHAPEKLTLRLQRRVECSPTNLSLIHILSIASAPQIPYSKLKLCLNLSHIAFVTSKATLIISGPIPSPVSYTHLWFLVLLRTIYFCLESVNC